MSLPLLNAKKQYFNQTGSPLAGGFVNFYVPGTLTRINTYQDQALSILNANPLQLDANGQCVAWIADGTSVREIVFDYLNNQIWDQVTAIGTGANFTSPSGSSFIGFQQLGSGAVARSAQDKMRERFSVKDFGAKGDGVTDDTAAIQLADTRASSLGALLYFPAGNYMVNASGITKGSCPWLGDRAVIKSLTQTYTTNGTYMVSAVSQNGFTIENMGFDFSQATFTAGAGNPGNLFYMFSLLTCSNFSFFNCSFTGIQAQNIGVAVNACHNWTVEECTFNQPVPSNSFNQAINISSFSGQSSNYLIRGNVINGTGILSAGSFGFITDNFISGTGFGAAIALGPDPNCLFNNISHNICINGIGRDINGTWPSGIECWSPYSVLQGNVCYNNSGHGIVQGGQSTIIDGNICLNNSQSGIGTNGITIVSIPSYNASECIISNNLCSDNQSVKTQPYGYSEQVIGGSPILNNTIVDNNFNHNLTGTMQMAGSAFSFRGPQLFFAGTIAPGAITNGSQYTTTFSVGGAAPGDGVKVAYGSDQSQTIFFGYVISANTVRVVVQNNTGSTQTLSSAACYLWVEKPASYASL